MRTYDANLTGASLQGAVPRRCQDTWRRFEGANVEPGGPLGAGRGGARERGGGRESV